LAYSGQHPRFTTETFRPQSADPSSPLEGMVFRSDGTSRTKGLWEYINSAWQPVGNIAIPPSSNKVENLGIAFSVAASAATIAIKTDGGTNPSATDIVSVGFRNATAATGQFSTVNITGALSLVVPSTATLGQSSAVAAYIYVYLINNAGTAELAVSRSLYDEGSVVSTVIINTGSDSAATIYSTTARSGVALRLVGRILNTQATAGTWASTATEISVLPFIPVKVVAVYNTNAGQPITTGGANKIIDFEDKVIDTHNAVTVGASWNFTAPLTDDYLVCFDAGLTSSTGWSGSEGYVAFIYVNGVQTTEHYEYPNGGGVDIRAAIAVSRVFRVTAGQTIDIRVFHNSGVTISMNPSEQDVWISITNMGV